MEGNSSYSEDTSSDENKDFQFEEEEEFYDTYLIFCEDDRGRVENIENSDDSVEFEIDV